MLETLTLKDVLDLGAQGIMAVAVVALWLRLNKVTDRWLDEKEQESAEREVLARLAGWTKQDLSAEAQRVRERREGSTNEPRE